VRIHSLAIGGVFQGFWSWHRDRRVFHEWLCSCSYALLKVVKGHEAAPDEFKPSVRRCAHVSMLGKLDYEH